MSRYTRYQNLIRQLGKNEVKLSDILADPVTINNPLFPIMANSELSYDELVVRNPLQVSTLTIPQPVLRICPKTRSRKYWLILTIIYDAHNNIHRHNRETCL